MVTIHVSVLVDLLKESMQKGNYPSLTVTSNSMFPLLRQDDKVVVAPIEAEQLKPGDIITIVTGSQLLTHRYCSTIIDTTGARLLTRGDRLLTLDPPSPAINLIGKVIARRRKQYELSLTSGPGSWLEQQIACLAMIEWRYLLPPSKSPGTTGLIQVSRQSSLARRLIRRLFLITAMLLTGIVEVINRIAGPKRSETEPVKPITGN